MTGKPTDVDSAATFKAELYNLLSQLLQNRMGKPADVASAAVLKPDLSGLLTLLQDHIGRFTGKKIRIQPTKKDITEFSSIIDRVNLIIAKLRELGGQPLTSHSARGILEGINSLFRIAMPDLAANREPIDELIGKVHELSAPPAGLVKLKGFDYLTKHRGLENFVMDVVKSASSEKIKAFYTAGLETNELIPQIQGVFSKSSLPKELRRRPTTATVKSSARVKAGLQRALSDWEAWCNLIYGLKLLERHQQARWRQIRGRVSLKRKVSAIHRDGRLKGLVRKNWVTVRNALDHGKASYNPAKGTIEFFDLHSKVSWSVEYAWRSGVNIYLANVAMMYTLNFVLSADMANVELVNQELRKITGGAAT
ncbi:MAG: hypothetical protein Q8O40_16110 [Chloroflexota bacterium]|nr:hypothetical protein [Chloroflexota bacterium]